MMRRRLVKAERGLMDAHPAYSGVRLYVHLMRHGHSDYEKGNESGINETGEKVLVGDAQQFSRQVAGSHVDNPNQITFIQHLSSEMPRARESAELRVKEVSQFFKGHADANVRQNVIVVPDPVRSQDLRLAALGPIATRVWEAGHPLFAGLSREDMKNELLVRQKGGEFPGIQHVYVLDGEQICTPGTRPSDVYQQIQGIVSAIVGHVQHSVATRYDPEAPRLNIHLFVISHEGLIAGIHALDPRHTDIDSGARATLHFDFKPSVKKRFYVFPSIDQRLFLMPTATMGFKRTSVSFPVSKILGDGVYEVLINRAKEMAAVRRPRT